MEIELTIYEDCSSLINKFVDCGDPCFKAFSQQWRDTNFQYIYGVQTTAIEVVQTTKAILHFAKRIACPNSNDFGKCASKNNIDRVITRIGGIYLIYAIYFKQPTNRFVKLLMSNETWQELTIFIQNLPMNINDQVRYIFWHLYKEDAFRFTGCNYDLGLENMVHYDRLHDVHNGNKCVDVIRENLRQKLIMVRETEQIIPHMISVEEQYNISKGSVLSLDKFGIALPPTKIFHSIHETIRSILDILDDQGNDDSLTKIKDDLNVNHKIKEIKRKASGYVTNNEETSEEEKSETKYKNQHWSARRMIDQQLPEVIMADINNSTDD